MERECYLKKEEDMWSSPSERNVVGLVDRVEDPLEICAKCQHALGFFLQSHLKLLSAGAEFRKMGQVNVES